MTSYSNVIQVGLGIIIMIFVGFTLAKTRVVAAETFNKLNFFLFKQCFPFLVTNSLARRDIYSFDLKCFCIGIFSCISVMIVFTIIFLFKFQDKFNIFLSTILPIISVNYIIIGLPIFNSIWGEDDNLIVFIVCLSNDIITIPIYLLMCSLYNVYKSNLEHQEKGEEKEKFTFASCGNILKNIFINPIILGYIVGISWSLLKLPIYRFFDTIILYMSQIVFAGSCLCVGSFLAQHSLISCPIPQFIACLIGRHIIMPTFSVLYCKLLKIKGKTAQQCVVLTALPTAVGSYLLASNCGVGQDTASTMIFWTTMIFLPAILVWMIVLDKLNVFPEDV